MLYWDGGQWMPSSQAWGNPGQAEWQSNPQPGAWRPAPPGVPPGYPPAGYPGGQPAEWKPGVIPLRRLSLGDILKGAVGYMRANPSATLGVSAIVLLPAAILDYLTARLLAAVGGTPGQTDNISTASGSVKAAALDFTDGLAQMLAYAPLVGVLAAVVGAAVFGHRMTIGQVWRRVRGRLPALLGVSAVLALVALLLSALAEGPWKPSPVILIGLLVWAAVALVALVFAPAVIVLEQATMGAAIRRSAALVGKQFWRIVGIGSVAFVLAFVAGVAVGVPFVFVGAIAKTSLGMYPGGFGPFIDRPGPLMDAMMAVGLNAGTVGLVAAAIITVPFLAGVTVLLYIDTRIRAEGFDRVLYAGSLRHVGVVMLGRAAGAAGQPTATEELWIPAGAPYKAH